MKKSRGRLVKKSRLIGRRVRKKRITLSEFVKTIDIGSKVRLTPYGKFEDFPPIKYSGKVGEVVGKQGGAYVVEITDGNKKKKIITSPVHLKTI